MKNERTINLGQGNAPLLPVALKPPNGLGAVYALLPNYFPLFIPNRFSLFKRADHPIENISRINMLLTMEYGPVYLFFSSFWNPSSGIRSCASAQRRSRTYRRNISEIASNNLRCFCAPFPTSFVFFAFIIILHFYRRIF